MDERCCLCSGALEEGLSCRDMLTEVPGEFLYRMCMDCGSLVQSPIPEQDFLNRCYDEYQPAYQKPGTAMSQGLAERAVTWCELQIYRLGAHFTDCLKTVNLVPSIAPPASILEVGCSYGERLHRLRNRGYAVTGLELSQVSVEEAKRLYGLDIICATMANAKFAASSFDIAIFSMVLEHLREPAAAIVELHRLLKPGGELLLSLPCVDGMEFSRFREFSYILQPPYHVFIPSLKGIRALVQDHFVIEKVAFQAYHRDLITSARWRNRTYADRILARCGQSKCVESFLRLGLYAYTLAGGKTSRVSLRLRRQ